MKPLPKHVRTARAFYNHFVMESKDKHPEWDELSDESMVFWNKEYKDRRELAKKEIVDGLSN